MASAIAVWQLRPGLNPWFEGWNVGSHSGSSTCRTASWTTLSTTSGIPSPRCPPPALGMNTRRIPPGRYLPASRSACNPGSTTSHCASSSSIVCPSGPGAPLFDATFNNASVNRSATSSIVADAAVPVLSIAFGAPARISPSRSRDLLRVAPCGFSAVAISRLSCTAVSSTGTAFPCPPELDPARSTGITPAFRYYSVLGLLLGHQSSSSRSPTYQPNPAGTQQISWGETLRLCRDRVATTPSVSIGIGHRRCETARPPRNALRRFTFVRHHDTPMAFSRPALTEAPAAHHQAALGTARSIPDRALASSVLDSPYQSSKTGLPPPISTSVPSTLDYGSSLRNSPTSNPARGVYAPIQGG